MEPTWNMFLSSLKKKMQCEPPGVCWVHPWKLGWNQKKWRVCLMFLLFQGGIFRFHVSSPECKRQKCFLYPNRLKLFFWCIYTGVNDITIRQPKFLKHFWSPFSLHPPHSMYVIREGNDRAGSWNGLLLEKKKHQFLRKISPQKILHVASKKGPFQKEAGSSSNHHFWGASYQF